MGKEVIEGILLGLTAVVMVVLVGVYITLGSTGIIIGAGVSAVLLVGQWFYFNRGDDQLESE
jgi:hypothetical protein